MGSKICAVILKLSPRRTLGNGSIIQLVGSMSRRDDSGICSYNDKSISFTKMDL